MQPTWMLARTRLGTEKKEKIKKKLKKAIRPQKQIKIKKTTERFFIQTYVFSN